MKNGLLLGFVICCLLSCKEREGYLIEGHVEGVPDSTVITLMMDAGDSFKTISRDTVSGGYFRFTGIPEKLPSRLELRAYQPGCTGSCVVWMENNGIKIKGKTKNLSQWDVVSDLKEQQQENRFKKASLQNRIRLDEAMEFRMNCYRTGIKFNNDSLSRLIDSLKVEIGNTNLQLMAQLPFSAVSAYYLHHIALVMGDLEKGLKDRVSREGILAQYERMEPALKESFIGQEVRVALFPPIVPEVGDSMADARLFDADSAAHQLSDYKGKYLLIDFWAKGCSACLQALPELRYCADKYKDELTVISVYLDREGLNKNPHHKKISWVNLTDYNGRFSGIAAQYGVTGLPCFYVIDPEGKVVKKWQGYSREIIKLQLRPYLEKR